MVCNIDEQTCELDTGKHMTGSLYIELIIFVNKIMPISIHARIVYLVVSFCTCIWNDEFTYVYSVVFFLCSCSSCVLCTLCCQFFWIVHFLLPLRFSLV